jgi:hypothetical protein
MSGTFFLFESSIVFGQPLGAFWFLFGGQKGTRPKSYVSSERNDFWIRLIRLTLRS